MAIDEPQPPYGLSYTSPGPPLFATPFITASNGAFNGNPFPLRFPPLNTSAKNPNSTFDFSGFEPIAGMTAPPPWNTYPYNENYFLSIERQFDGNTRAELELCGIAGASSAAGVFRESRKSGAVPGFEPARARWRPGSPTCGPFGEDTTYTTAAGQTIQGTRSGLGPAFANDDYDASIGNSNYNAFEATLRHSTKNLTFLIGYTYSKSIDQASSISDPVNPYNFSATRALSAFDLTHNFVASFQYQLPFDRSRTRSSV